MKKFVNILIGVILAMSMLTFASCNNGEEKEERVAALTDKTSIETYANLYGRDFYSEDLGGWCFYNSASGFEFRFYGTQLTVEWMSNYISGYGQREVSLFLDGETDSEANIVTVGTFGNRHFRTLVKDLEEGEHTLKVLKRLASNQCSIVLFSVETDGYFMSPPARPAVKLDVYGDSITCGEGVMRTVNENNEAQGGYTALTQNALKSYSGVAASLIDAELQIFGRGGGALIFPASNQNCVYKNYKSIALDLPAAEYPYDYSSYSPDAVVIYLGTNDYNFGRAQGIYSGDVLGGYFKRFIREAIGNHYGTDIPIVLCYGIMVPNSDLDEVMEQVKADLKSEFPNIDTVSFEPTAYGHPVVSDSLVAGAKLAEKLTEMLGL